MHIAYYAPSWPPGESANGIVTYVRYMRDELISTGHAVTVVSGDTAYFDDGTSTTVPTTWKARVERKAATLLDGGRVPLPGTAYQLGRVFRTVHQRRPIDVIEMEESFGWPPYVQQRIDVPLVTRLHGPHFLAQQSFAEKLSQADDLRISAEGRAIRGARAVTAPSSAVLRQTLDRYNAVPSLSRWISNPIAPAPTSRRWDLTRCNPFAFLMVGRFDQRKGADLALQAMEIVCRQEPRARLTLVGPDSGIEVGGRKRKFEEYCREHLSPAARASIRFLGSVGPQELSELRLDSLAALLCSRWENLSYALTEAMAMGCPIVTTRSHEDDVVKHGETALVAQRSDPQILANHMLLLMKKPALAQVLGQNAFAQCVRLYSPPVVADTTLAFYREVLMFSDDPRRWHSPKSNP